MLFNFLTNHLRALLLKKNKVHLMLSKVMRKWWWWDEISWEKRFEKSSFVYFPFIVEDIVGSSTINSSIIFVQCLELVLFQLFFLMYLKYLFDCFIIMIFNYIVTTSKIPCWMFSSYSCCYFTPIHSTSVTTLVWNNNNFIYIFFCFLLLTQISWMNCKI